MVVLWCSATLKVPQLEEDKTSVPHTEVKISVDLRGQEVPRPNLDPHREDAHPVFVSPTTWADPSLLVLCPRVQYDPLPARASRADAVTAMR